MPKSRNRDSIATTSDWHAVLLPRRSMGPIVELRNDCRPSVAIAVSSRDCLRIEVRTVPATADPCDVGNHRMG